VHNGKSYVIAYSLREQKRANDLKEAFLYTLWIIIGLLVALYAKLDAMNVISKLVG
jgi:hypothetical protein